MASSSQLLFIQCGSEKDLGDRSKSNEGQVNVVRQALKRTPKNTPEEEESKESEMNLKVTAKSLYYRHTRNKSKHYVGG